MGVKIGGFSLLLIFFLRADVIDFIDVREVSLTTIWCIYVCSDGSLRSVVTYGGHCYDGLALNGIDLQTCKEINERNRSE